MRSTVGRFLLYVLSEACMACGNKPHDSVEAIQAENATLIKLGSFERTVLNAGHFRFCAATNRSTLPSKETSDCIYPGLIRCYDEV